MPPEQLACPGAVERHRGVGARDLEHDATALPDKALRIVGRPMPRPRATTSQTLQEPLVHAGGVLGDRKSTRLNSSHLVISYAVFCLKKKKKTTHKPMM